MKKSCSLRISQLSLEISTPLIYQTVTDLKMLSISSLCLLNMHGERMPNKPISLNILRPGRIKTVIDLWETIGHQKLWKIGKLLRKQSKPPSKPSLTSKSKKLLIRNEDLGSSWIGSINAICQLLKPSNTMTDYVYQLKNYGTYSIQLSTLLFIAMSMLMSFTKSLTNPPLHGSHFLRKSLGVLSLTIITLLHQDCCGNHLSQGQMITQGVNLLVEVSSGKFTRELDKEPLLN